jgi:hypothetical protein
MGELERVREGDAEDNEEVERKREKVDEELGRME